MIFSSTILEFLKREWQHYTSGVNVIRQTP